MKKLVLSNEIFLIEDFWSGQKCDDFITTSEATGYEPATIQTENGPRLVDHIRNNNRVLYKDFELAKKLWIELSRMRPRPLVSHRLLV